MQRREFSKLCTSLIASALAQSTHAGPGARATTGNAAGNTPYPASGLTREPGVPLLASDVPEDQAYVFHYPFVTTPCFLVRHPGRTSARADIDEPAELVAFSAICSHKMTHPARPISHISYRSDPVGFFDREGVRHERAGVISCCSERSVYDAFDNGRVLAGPATQALARIRLAVDPQGRICATGSEGPDQYEAFLKQFGFRLAMEHGITDVRARTGTETLAIPANRFSRQQVRC